MVGGPAGDEDGLVVASRAGLLAQHGGRVPEGEALDDLAARLDTAVTGMGGRPDAWDPGQGLRTGRPQSRTRAAAAASPRRTPSDSTASSANALQLGVPGHRGVNRLNHRW